MERELLRRRLDYLTARLQDMALLRNAVMAEAAMRARDASYRPCERTLCDAMRESLTDHIARLTQQVRQVERQLEQGEVRHGR